MLCVSKQGVDLLEIFLLRKHLAVAEQDMNNEGNSKCHAWRYRRHVPRSRQVGSDGNACRIPWILWTGQQPRISSIQYGCFSCKVERVVSRSKVLDAPSKCGPFDSSRCMPPQSELASARRLQCPRYEACTTKTRPSEARDSVPRRGNT